MRSSEALARLNELHAKSGDEIESAHIEADRVLCEVLIAQGLDEVVKAWEAVPRVYGSTEMEESQIVITDKMVDIALEIYRSRRKDDPDKDREFVEGLIVNALVRGQG